MYGVHPFGAHYEREMNIVKHKSTLLASDPLLDDLIRTLIEHNPRKRLVLRHAPHACWVKWSPYLEAYSHLPLPRLSAEQALMHPYFWSPTKILAFLMDVSDRCEKEAEDAPLRQRLEDNANVVCRGEDWSVHLTEDLLAGRILLCDLCLLWLCDGSDASF